MPPVGKNGVLCLLCVTDKIASFHFCLWRMFRGRCGYDAVGNRQIREKAANHRREVQKTRLDKIKNRKPGTSLNTLDNLPPVVVKAVLTNPRKQLLKAELNLTVDQENKCVCVTT